MASRTDLRRRLAAPLTLVLLGLGLAVGAAPAVAADTRVQVDPGTVSQAQLASSGVLLTGATQDTASDRDVTVLTVTAPSGASATYSDASTDGSFHKRALPKGALKKDPVEAGTWTVRATSASTPSDTASTTFEVTASVPAQTQPPSVTITPASTTQSAFLADGVKARGFTYDSPSTNDGTRLVVTSPSGASARYSDQSADGTFRKLIFPKRALRTDPLETGTWTVRAISRVDRSVEATTTFEVTADAPTPATVTVTPSTLSQTQLGATGVLATGRTQDTASDHDATVLTVTAPSGASATYSDSSADGSFRKRILPKGALEADPLETGTWTVVATSRSTPSSSAATTFAVTADPVSPPTVTPRVTATASQVDQSTFTASGVNLSGVADSAGTSTAHRVRVTKPGGQATVCTDTTADATFDIQVYPGAAPTTTGRTTCSLAAPATTAVTAAASAAAPVGTYQVDVLDAAGTVLASTTFRVTADAADNNGTGTTPTRTTTTQGSSTTPRSTGSTTATRASSSSTGVLPSTGGVPSLVLAAGLSILTAGLVLVVSATVQRRRA